MRGVCLRGRRLPASRSAGPARPPVLPAAVPVLAARPSGRRLRHRPHDRARRAAPRDRHPWEYYPQRRCQPRHHPRHRAPWGLPPCGTGTTTSILADAPLTCTDSRCRHQPSGVNGALATAIGPAAPPCPRGSVLPSPRAWPRPGPARHGRLPGRLCTGSPAQARIAGPCGSCSGATSSPVRPPIGHRSRGAVATLDQFRPRADLANQPCHGTGHGPDLCRYRQPGATSCRVCRMFPIACYGLTPRCREVKR